MVFLTLCVARAVSGYCDDLEVPYTGVPGSSPGIPPSGLSQEPPKLVVSQTFSPMQYQIDII